MDFRPTRASAYTLPPPCTYPHRDFHRLHFFFGRILDMGICTNIHTQFIITGWQSPEAFDHIPVTLDPPWQPTNASRGLHVGESDNVCKLWLHDGNEYNAANHVSLCVLGGQHDPIK